MKNIKVRIMVVDDSMLMRNKLIKVLEGLRYEVVETASDGVEAIEKFRECLPDIVTMDISMPNMNGIKAVEAIIKEFPKAKIIMLSAINQKALVVEAIEKGAKHYIVKPFSEEKIRSVIDQVMWEM
jgi:two-component system chemotaxis response regulator CheY